MSHLWREHNYHRRGVPVVTVVTPAGPLLTAQDLNRRLRLDLSFDSPMSDEDMEVQTDVESMIAAATAMLDGPTGTLGRALGPQTLKLSLRTCGERYVQLPFPPILSIESIEWDDADGATTVMDGADYLLQREAVRFPAGAPDAADMRITYRAGYSDGASPEAANVPANLLQAIRLLVGDMWAWRESGASGNWAEFAVPTAVKHLIAPFKVYAVG